MSIFAESEIFRGMFGLPQQRESNSNSAGNPLIMPELKAAEFRVFVRAALAQSVRNTRVRASV
jgi:hypothetical protein